MRKPLLLYALVAAVLFVACSPEEQPAETDKTPFTDTSDVEIAFPEGELTIDLDFNNEDKVYDFNTPDIIFIHGGTNDNTLKSELGTIQCDLPIWEVDDFKFRSAYASGIHPNPVGHAFMAKKIYESCKEYLQ